jgi:hypothetical protein
LHPQQLIFVGPPAPPAHRQRADVGVRNLGHDVVNRTAVEQRQIVANGLPTAIVRWPEPIERAEVMNPLRGSFGRDWRIGNAVGHQHFAGVALRGFRDQVRSGQHRPSVVVDVDKPGATAAGVVALGGLGHRGPRGKVRRRRCGREQGDIGQTRGRAAVDHRSPAAAHQKGLPRTGGLGAGGTAVIVCFSAARQFVVGIEDRPPRPAECGRRNHQVLKRKTPAIFLQPGETVFRVTPGRAPGFLTREHLQIGTDCRRQ